MVYILLGIFLIIEGLNRLGLRFAGDEVVKGILLTAAGLFLTFEYL